MKPNVFEGFEINFTDAYRQYKQDYKNGVMQGFLLINKKPMQKPVITDLETTYYSRSKNIHQRVEIYFRDFYIYIHEHGDKKGECDYNILIKTLDNSTKEDFAKNLITLFHYMGLEASVLGDSQCIEVLDLPYYQDYYISVEGAWRDLGNYKNYVGVTKQHIQNLLLNTNIADKEGNLMSINQTI